MSSTSISFLVSEVWLLRQDFNFNIVDLHFFVRIRTQAALVAENFRLSWVDPESHFFSTFLEFVHHFLKLFFGCCELKHVVGEPQVCEAVVVVVTQVDSHSFFLLPALGEFCRTVLNSKLDRGSPCLVPFLISNMFTSVCTDAFWSLS